MNVDSEKRGLQTLVSTEWLASNLDAGDLKILDASWYMPAEQRDCLSEYKECHVPGAQFFDIDRIADTSIDLPHMVPSDSLFAESVSALGIGDDDRVVVYDTSGLFSAARVWWLFRLMDKTEVAVLEGGLPKWLEEGRDVEAGMPRVETSRLSVDRQADMLKSIEQVDAALKSESHQVVDARPASRFKGEAPEPRAGLRSGHMPGARNLAYSDVLQAGGLLKPVSEIEAAFEAAGVDLNCPIITSCGSGVTAAVLCLALEHAGHRDHSIYDGSWSEWGGCMEFEVVTGDA